MLRHRVNTTDFSLDFSLEALSNVVEAEIPEPPTNLQGVPEQQGLALRLSWEAPLTGVRPVLYEIFLDGAFLAKTNSLHYVLNDIQYGVHYLLKVRSVAVLGGRSVFTPELDYIGGGQPTMRVRAYSFYLAIQLAWEPVESNVDYTIEGYNVYEVNHNIYNKLNPSLLPLDELDWEVYPLTANLQYRFAVAYEYNGGQLSPYYEITEVPQAKPGGSYWVSGIGHASGVIVGAKGSGKGIEVDRGTMISLGRFRTSGPTARQWANAPYTDWYNSIGGKKREIWRQFYGYAPNCPPTIRIEKGDDIDNVQFKGIITASMGRTDRYFTITGPACNPMNNHPSSVLLILNIGSTAHKLLADTGGFSIFSVDVPRHVTVTVTGDKALVKWSNDYVSNYNVFVRELGGQFIKMNSSPIVGTSFLLENLSIGSYDVAVGLVHPDGYETKPLMVMEPVRMVIV